METVRIIVHKNASSPGSGTSMLINSNYSYKELLAACSKTLGSEFCIIYNETGRQITSVQGLKDRSCVYLSKGEEFLVKKSSNSSEPVFVMLGAAGVGKSAITLRYIRNIFVDYYDPTIEDYYKYTTNVNGEVQNLSILDTAGMEDYEPLLDE